MARDELLEKLSGDEDTRADANARELLSTNQVAG